MDRKTAAPMSLWTLGLIAMGLFRLVRGPGWRGRSHARSRGGMGGGFSLFKWLLPVGLFFLVRWVMNQPGRDGSGERSSERMGEGYAAGIPVSGMHPVSTGTSVSPGGMATGMNTGIGAGVTGGAGVAGGAGHAGGTGMARGMIGATTGMASMYDIPARTVTPPESITQPRQGETRRDDLREIEGIGPAISERLHNAGIHSFRQLAETDPARLNEILEDERLRNITNTDSWPEQARLADTGDWEGLRALKERLKGGRQA